MLAKPVAGADQVKTVMGTASQIYEALAFTHQATSGLRSYLEWEAQAFGGEKLSGITILTRNEEGKIVHAAIHHRPLGGALKFSAELGRRLQGQGRRGPLLQRRLMRHRYWPLGYSGEQK